MLKKHSKQELNSLFDKKPSIEKYSSTQLGYLFFSFFLILGIYTSLPISPETKNSYPKIPVVEHTVKKTNLYSPDLIAPSILNYKTTQNINKASYKEYLKHPEAIIDFTSFSNDTINYQLNDKNVMNGISHIKSLMVQEDLSIVPFDSGEVDIESDIIETTQSDNFYMVEVLKTFTQNRKTVRILERKVFDLKEFEMGKIYYVKNILYTHSLEEK